MAAERADGHGSIAVSAERADASDFTGAATLTLTPAALDRFILGETTLDAEAAAGEISVEPGIAPLEELVSLLDTFEGWFNIIEP